MSRATRAGGEIQTLDVVVSDSGGPRPYESFSGGERIRVDLALSVSLARLAARRAGRPPVRFFWVDEAFTPLDRAGVEAAVRALGSWAAPSTSWYWRSPTTPRWRGSSPPRPR
jgi:exonuclease SbcC